MNRSRILIHFLLQNFLKNQNLESKYRQIKETWIIDYEKSLKKRKETKGE